MVSGLAAAGGGTRRASTAGCSTTRHAGPSWRRRSARSASCSRTSCSSRASTSPTTWRSGCGPAACARPPRARGRSSGWSAWASVPGAPTASAGSRAARRSGSPWPVRWRPGPRALLLDEPLSALDADVRATVRRDLRDHLRCHEGPRILVTHDPLDAAVLADRVVVLEDGRITASGQLAELVAHPRSAWAAELAGHEPARGDGPRHRAAARRTGACWSRPSRPATVRCSWRSGPRPWRSTPSRPEGSPRNVWPGTVAEVEGFGERRRVRLDGAGAGRGRGHRRRPDGHGPRARRAGVGEREGDRAARVPGLTSRTELR